MCQKSVHYGSIYILPMCVIMESRFTRYPHYLTCCECPLLLDTVVVVDLVACDPLPWSPDNLSRSCDKWSVVPSPCLLEVVFTDAGRETPTVACVNKQVLPHVHDTYVQYISEPGYTS